MKYYPAYALARFWPRPLSTTQIVCCEWGDGADCRSSRRAGRQEGNGVFGRPGGADVNVGVAVDANTGVSARLTSNVYMRGALGVSARAAR